MSTPADRTTAGWTAEHERGNFWTLRLMRRIAMTAGRRIARVLLHPISLYFLVFNTKARRESARFLSRVLMRPARLRDVYRHIHCFASTILDRVYFLQERFDQFDIRSTGADPVRALLAGGAGVMLAGAHLGSFEALRASAQGRGVRVAVLMYEDNARMINAALAAVAPNVQLHTIALGRAGAMLGLRRWLDEGGVAGLLADRTLPGGSERCRTLTLDFLGAPAQFSDGPFRLAAMLRRPLYFMTGLYQGGNRYELRFSLLEDFSVEVPSDGPSVDQRVRTAVERYVTLLASLCVESPYNWFNFYDFWALDNASA